MPEGIENFVLSTDERYLFEISRAVASGSCSQALANKMPGPSHHARWMTKGSRVLRYYISSKEPSKNLIDIATFIMKVYVPMYFQIKHKHSCIHMSKHFFNILKYSSYLPSHYFKVVRSVCETNFYAAHPENLLLGMIFDDDACVRKIGYNKILECRKNACDSDKIREYIAPTMIFNTNTICYYELIDWTSEHITEPPFTMRISSHEIHMLSQTGEKINDCEILLIPNHIQATERHIKIVSEVTRAAATKERREGIISAKIISRRKRPKFESKKDF